MCLRTGGASTGKSASVRGGTSDNERPFVTVKDYKGELHQIQVASKNEKLTIQGIKDALSSDKTLDNIYNKKPIFINGVKYEPWDIKGTQKAGKQSYDVYTYQSTIPYQFGEKSGGTAKTTTPFIDIPIKAITRRKKYGGETVTYKIIKEKVYLNTDTEHMRKRGYIFND